jgi:hypothetical protein
MSDWRKYNGALISNRPPHIDLNTREISLLLKEKKALFARWVTDFDSEKETEFWHVICDKNISIDKYSVNTRSKIKRGLKNCEVKKISKQEIIENAYEVYENAFLKYTTHSTCQNKVNFMQDIKSLGTNWEFFGVYYKEKLIAYCMCSLKDSTCNYSTIKFHPQYLKYYSSYALFHTMNQYYLGERKLKYVNDGARNLVHKTNVQDFLITKFGFRKAYCKLHVKYSLMLRFMVLFIYPLRFVFYRFNNKFAVKITALLFQEKIRRSFL